MLLLAVSLQILNKAVIYIDYYANTAAYAKNCVNKALPLMKCNGKCQMMKKLKQEEKKDSQAPERKPVNDQVISSRSFFATLDHFSIDSHPYYYSFQSDGLVNMPRYHFHPPGA